MKKLITFFLCVLTVLSLLLPSASALFDSGSVTSQLSSDIYYLENLDEGTVFFVPTSSPLSYLGELMGDFAYIILLIMSFLALCFDDSKTGIVSVVIIAVKLLVAACAYYRS
jgi:hypothetical protein